MPLSVVQVVVTDNFAGVERYVATTAAELAARGCAVAVVGGASEPMQAALGRGVRWLPGGSPQQAIRSLAGVGRCDVCHAHMTLAEAAAVVSRPLHRGAIVATRHFVAPRGSTPVSRSLKPMIEAAIRREIAASRFIASRMDRKPDAVLPNGLRPSRTLWDAANRKVVVLQRLEREKDTRTALDAWALSRLWEEGWSLRIVGEGAERPALEDHVALCGLEQVEFAGWVADVDAELAGAGMVLAPAPAEGFGLTVVEAMGAGIPVVACAGGGHLETVGRLPGARLFPPQDAAAAAAALRSLASDPASRAELAAAGRELVASEFSLASHVDRLLDEYAVAMRRRPKRRRNVAADRSLKQLVVCSLEAWDDIWRRNQFLVDALLRRNPQLRVLFVEPSADPVFDIASRRRPTLPSLRTVGYEGRLQAVRPLKPLPRRAGPVADAVLRTQVRALARVLKLDAPILWINDVTYAPLIRTTGWPAVYDVTDDWLAAPFAPRELDRLRRLEDVALRDAESVVVCSSALAVSRGERRPVTVIANAVDAEHFRRSRPRPTDMPAAPVAVYVGSLHDSRLDVDLVVDLARSRRDIHVVLVGPNSLSSRSHRRLVSEPNILLAGPRRYADVPAYLQHADVIIVPHLVNDFTESLDPIKAYECLASGTPTVATPVAGFRTLAPQVTVAPRDHVVASVASVLENGRSHAASAPVPGWEDRARAFEEILLAAAGARA